jgi:hypothetical protein
VRVRRCRRLFRRVTTIGAARQLQGPANAGPLLSCTHGLLSKRGAAALCELSHSRRSASRIAPSVKRRLPDTQFATVRFFDLGFFLELRIFRSELHYLGVEVGTSSLSRQAWQDTACRMT